MNLTPELIADLRKKAEAAERENHTTEPAAGLGPLGLAYVTAAGPAVVIALLDRIADLETDLYEERMGEDL